MFRRLPTRRTLVTGVIFADLLILLVVFIFTSKRSAQPPPFIVGHPYFLYDLDSSEPREPNQKCVLPRVHPFHPSIWNYLTPPKSIVCKSRQGELTYLEQGGNLRFNGSELDRTGYEPGKTLYCHWSPVLRGGVNQDDDDRVNYGNKFPFNENGTQLPPEVEIIRVLCRNFAGFSVYEKLHVRIRDITTESSPKRTLKNPINVLIFGLDSMSRLAFIRMLPHTYRYLTEDLHMTVLRGMNKVGDNTYPNLIAMLTGDKAYGGGLPEGTGFFDGWPLIWNNYSEVGYGTLWAEDFPQYGLFNYLAKGFRSVPTDHYLRPLWLALERSSILKFSSHMCYGSQPKHLLQMEYVRQYVSKYKKARKPYFGFSFLAELSHEYLSPISAADDHFEAFFRFLNDGGHLKDTVLIVMSDHGHRFDAIRATEVGHIEERMPFFAIHIPQSISSLQPSIQETLSVNSRRLVTPFDTHATLVDLLHFATSGRPLGGSVAQTGTLGQSLFKEVPLERTCSGASIPVHYCTCEAESPLSESDVRAISAAEATIRRINDLIQEGGPDIEEVCAVLSLKVIRTAHLVQAAEEPSDTKYHAKVRVVVEAEPSGAIFEATSLVGDQSTNVLVDVSRINPYGDQSSCIQHAILRKYCYCNKYLKTS